MARFRFRLEASLRLAEQALEKAQREYAQEVQRLNTCEMACTLQNQHFQEAQEGQRDAAKNSPAELGVWQQYTVEHQRRLRQFQAELKEQEVIVGKARHCLLEAHRESEKFRRHKEKQAETFRLDELNKEQKVLDETGQVVHWRQKISMSD